MVDEADMMERGRGGLGHGMVRVVAILFASIRAIQTLLLSFPPLFFTSEIIYPPNSIPFESTLVSALVFFLVL